MKAHSALERGVASGFMVLAAFCVQMIHVIPYSFQPIHTAFAMKQENTPCDHFPWSGFLDTLGNQF